MPKVRRVLGACTVEIAQRRRICSRDRKNHPILKGTLCLVIKDPGGGTPKNCCRRAPSPSSIRQPTACRHYERACHENPDQQGVDLHRNRNAR
jgi:hypothetical protein